MMVDRFGYKAIRQEAQRKSWHRRRQARTLTCYIAAVVLVVGALMFAVAAVQPPR